MLSLRRLITRSTPLRLAPPVLKTQGNAVTRYSNPFSTSIVSRSQRTKYINAHVEENGPDYKSIEIDTALLLETLRNMQSYRRLTPNDSKSNEYRSALRAVSQVSGADGGVSRPKLTIEELEGVITPENGVTWRVISELLKFGFSTELESVDDSMKSAIMFNRVHGFGKIRSLALAENGARTLEDLLESEEKEYGRKIAKAQKLAIQHHKDMELMIPRKEVEVFKDLFEKAFKAADPETNFEIMGSFRRGEEVSSDIDVVVWHPSFVTRDKDEKRAKKVAADSIMGKVLIALSNANLLDPEMMFSEGEKKSMFLTRLPNSPGAVYRQIDIRLCPTESLPYMLLGNSGDDSLMKLLRWRAMEKGLALNEYGMGKRSNEVPNGWPIDGTEIMVKDEKEIFERLGVPYLEPHQRKYTYYRTFKPFREWGV